MIICYWKDRDVSTAVYESLSGDVVDYEMCSLYTFLIQICFILCAVQFLFC